MSPRALSMSPDYLASVRGLRELHRLIARGEGEAPQCDALRDSLEAPWYRMTEAEKERVNHLSADLYSISDSPHAVQLLTPEAERGLLAAFAARKVGDWDLALSLLRQWGACLQPAELAALRGEIWRQAGDPETAAAFREHAVTLDPSIENVDESNFRAHVLPGRS